MRYVIVIVMLLAFGLGIVEIFKELATLQPTVQRMIENAGKNGLKQ